MSESVRGTSDALPQNWSVGSLGAVCQAGGGSIQTGPFGSQLHADDYKEQGVPIITVEHLLDGRISHDNLPLVGKDDYRRLSRYKLITGDLVFSRVGAIDRCAYVSEKENGWLFSGRCLRVRTGKAESNPRFLAYLLNSWHQRQWILNHSVGSTMACLNTAILSNVPVQLPPTEQQRKIALILTTVDELIEQTEALIAKYQAIKQGMMHDLFTRGVHEHGQLRATYEEAPELYKQSELGWIPKEWETPTFDGITIADSPICYGIVQPGEYVESGVPVVAIYVLHSDFRGCHRSSQSIEAKYVRSRVRGGDVLLSVKGTTGRVDVVPTGFEGNISRDIARIRPRDGVSADFVRHMLESSRFQRHLNNAIVGTTRAELSIGVLRGLCVVLPSFSEQRRISTSLQSIDARLRTERNSHGKLCHQKSGLMQELLTGKVSVKQDESEDSFAHV